MSIYKNKLLIAQLAEAWTTKFESQSCGLPVIDFGVFLCFTGLSPFPKDISLNFMPNLLHNFHAISLLSY